MTDDMSTETENATGAPRRVVDYDGYGYDYRRFWQGRDYEQWAEARVLRRLMLQFGRPRWFADFGGGFGRNSRHYRGIADHSIVVDYSVTNLTRASDVLKEDIDAGRIHLIRSDLNKLPLIDSAVDGAMVVRVLHHLTDVDATIVEMGRTVGRRWLVDVPIKHHALGRLRSAAHGRYREMRTQEPLITGSSDYPFRTFSLAHIRRGLDTAGWATQLVASVNNFRRWDQVLPNSAVRVLRPVVYSMEVVAQSAGRGWWGPSQFVMARRRRLKPAQLRPVADDVNRVVAALAQRLWCPVCHGDLTWTAEAASCAACTRDYPRRALYWDFVVD